MDATHAVSATHAASATSAAAEPEAVGAVPVPLVAGLAGAAGAVLGVFFGPTLAKHVEKVSPRAAAAMRSGLMGADGDGLGSPDPTLRGVWPPPKGPPPGRAGWGSALGAVPGPGVPSYDAVTRQATEAMVRGGQDKGVLPLELGTAMLTDLPKLLAVFAAKGVYVTAPGAAVPAGYAEVSDPDPGTDYRGVTMLAQLGRVRFYKAIAASASTPALAPSAGTPPLLPPAGGTAATPASCPRGCVVSGAEDLGAGDPGDYGHLDGGEGDLAGDGTAEGTTVGATPRRRPHAPAAKAPAAKAPTGAGQAATGHLVGDGTAEGTRAHGGSAHHARGVHGLDGVGQASVASGLDDDGLGWAREIGPEGHRYRVAIEKVTPKAAVPVADLEKLKGALDAITKALPPGPGNKAAGVAGADAPADALEGDGSADDAGCLAGDDLEGDGTERVAGIGDDVFRGIVKSGKAIGDVWIPGAGTALAEGTTAIKRRIDEATEHVDPNDPVVRARLAKAERARQAEQAKKDQAAAAPTAAVAGHEHEETTMSDQVNGGGGDDVGASPTKGIPGTPLKNGQSYTARGKGVKVINEPKVARWIWANYGAPLKKAKAHVVRLQKSGAIMVAQLQECRAALQAAGLSAPDYGMPDLTTSDLDLSDVSDDDGDDFAVDDLLSGAHDEATAATVAGIVGGADGLGATPAERRARRAAIAAKKEAHGEHAHVQRLQKTGSHLAHEVEELKAQLAQAKAQNRDHALVHQMERALAYAIRALEAENAELRREMISPAGPRHGFPGGYGDPRMGLAGASSASGAPGAGLAGVPPYVPGSAPMPTPEAEGVGCAPCTGLGPSVGPAPYYPGYPGIGSGFNPIMN